MDKSLQQILVGVAVLVALAVIFLPMIFDGKEQPGSVEEEVAIPPKPVYDIPQRVTPEPAPPVVINPQGMPGQNAMQSAQSPSAQPPVMQQREVVNQAAEPVTSPVTTTSAPPVQSLQSEVQKQPEPKPKPQPVQPAPSANTGAGFVVQVGSFSKQDNALVLKDKLTASGYPAFVEPIKMKGISIYRVKVGPRPSRGAVDELRLKLKEKEKLEGIVVAHP